MDCFSVATGPFNKCISISHCSQALIDNNYSDDNINLPDTGKGAVSWGTRRELMMNPLEHLQLMKEKLFLFIFRI